jgi:hypothetical protein
VVIRGMPCCHLPEVLFQEMVPKKSACPYFLFMQVQAVVFKWIFCFRVILAETSWFVPGVILKL